MRITPFSPGRRWYCDRNTTVLGNHRPPFTFIILGPGSDANHKRCRLEYDQVWLECCGYHGTGLSGKLESLGNGLEAEYSHKHLKQYAVLVEGTPTVHAPDPDDPTRQVCCRCQKLTYYWTNLPDRKPGEQVALCPGCAPITHPGQIPTKDAWVSLERARHPVFHR